MWRQRTVRTSGALVVWVVCVGSAACGGAPSPTNDRGPSDVRAAADGVAAWLTNVAVKTEDGLAWPVDASRPAERAASLAEGTAGIVWFFLAHHLVTGAAESLSTAIGGANWLAAHAPRMPASGAFPPATSLYYGAPGMAVVLDAVATTAGTPRHRVAARELLQLVARATMRDGDEARWSETFNELLFGNAGTTLFLLWAADALGPPETLDLAVAGGRGLIARGEAGGEARLIWRFRNDREFILPNFSHGAAGVGYVLARLFERTGRADFLDAARAAGLGLLDIAERRNDGLIVPYGRPIPEWATRRELGWAHGPVGTVRVFEALASVERDEVADRRRVWREAARALMTSVRHGVATFDERDSSVDEASAHDLRFGLAGAVGALVDAGDIALAREAALRIVRRSSRDATGLRWESVLPAFHERAGEPAVLTGYLHGAAGYGFALLRIVAAEKGGEWPLRLPDDPRATRR